LNIQGLVTKSANKLEQRELIDLLNSNDFVFLTETWSNEQTELSVPEFTHFCLHRTLKRPNTKRDSGGLCCYIHNKFARYVSLYKSDNDDILWLKVSNELMTNDNDLYICLCYVIPEGSSRSELVQTSVYDRISSHMSQILAETGGTCSFTVLGDMNSRVGNLSDFVINDEISAHVDLFPDDYVTDTPLPRFTQDSHVNTNGRHLIDFCRESGLRILNGRFGNDNGVGKYTFHGAMGSSLIDYVLSSTDLLPLVNTFNICDPNILTDHCALHFSIEMRPINFTRNGVPNTKGSNPASLTHRYKWDNNKTGEYINCLQSDSFTSSLNDLMMSLENTNEHVIDENIATFSNIMNDVCNPLFGKVFKPNYNATHNVNKDSQLWFDDECSEKRDHFYEDLNKFRDKNSDANRKQLCKSRSEYKTIIRNKKYNVRKANTDKLINARLNNAKLYWKLLKDNTTPVKRPIISADNFAIYFKSINNADDRFYQADEDIIDFNNRFLDSELQVMFAELDAEISQEEILKSIKSLKLNKSGGPDIYVNEFFIHGSSYLLPYLTKLFNVCLNSGYFPEKWSEGFVVPIHKSGDTNDPSNYRGITLLSTLGKLFTSILNNRLDEWAESNFVYIEAQAGFRKGMGTVDNIFILHNVINHCLNNGDKLFCAFVDFKKAFDFVVRDILWFKLMRYGVKGNILKVIRSMYNNVKSRVKVFESLSDEFTCTLGVRQGDCLSPFLFSIFINDIEQTLNNDGIEGINIGSFKLMLLLYADDIILFAKDAEGLQKSLDSLSEYCDRWKLTVNTQKTKIMIFRKSGKLPKDLKFIYGNENLEIVNKFKYLGVLFTTGISYNEHDKMLAGQSLKATFKLNKYLTKFTDLSPKHTTDLFNKLIVPILTYSSEVWGFNKGVQVERSQLKFYKKLLGVKTSTQNSFIYFETGTYDLCSLRYYNIIKYWLKICTTNDIKYTKQIYNAVLQYNVLNPQKITWVSKVKQLLGELGFNHVWISQGVGDIKCFLSMLKQRLQDIHIQHLHANLNSSTRAIFYKNIATFEFCQYLDTVNIKKYRFAMTRLRLSSHRLAIETGRWKKPTPVPFDERKCTVCKTLEDEYHFIIECNVFRDLREHYIPEYYWKHPNSFKLIQLVNNCSVSIIQNLATYIFKAFERKTNLNLLN